MRFILFAMFLVGFAVFGCNDGKFNLVVYIPEWNEKEEDTEIEFSSATATPISSSQEIPLSSNEQKLSSSSEEPPPPSSSSRGETRSSTSKIRDGYVYEDYPTFEIGAPGVKMVYTTRYWDGCKATCSWPENIGNPNPWAICKACDRGGVNEIPLMYLHPRSDQWGIYWDRVKSAWDDNTDVEPWFKSETYDTWRAKYPGQSGERSLAYTCYNQAPYAVNDTLAYAFAAVKDADCGSCYRLQFVSDEWRHGNPRVTHKALKGKTLIVMASNTGTVGEDHFDIMIPGMGTGALDCFSEQMGEPAKSKSIKFGPESGGLLANCVFPNGDTTKPGEFKPSDRWSLEEWQTCLRDECHKAFDGRPKELLNGCLWMADWFMAADNPYAYASEVQCPQYLKDRYNSKLTTELPKRPEGWDKTFQIDGYHTYDGN